MRYLNKAMHYRIKRSGFNVWKSGCVIRKPVELGSEFIIALRAIKVRLYLGKQLVTSLAVLSPNEPQEIIVNLSDNEEWRELKPNEETINLKAVYENVYERVFVSAIKGLGG